MGIFVESTSIVAYLGRLEHPHSRNGQQAVRAGSPPHVAF
eukprot:COSAG02_NODE_53009_length_304_cov_0.960976_1_plen_39_part_10